MFSLGNFVNIINNVTAKDSGHKQRPELNFAIRCLHGNLRLIQSRSFAIYLTDIPLQL